jgi:GMP synthase PP-ATPase subunit
MVSLRRHYNIRLVHHDVGELFLARLAGFTDSEEKRKDEFLVQGTPYPRHPFPDPAWRCASPGEITRERLEILREADAMFLYEIENLEL